jgi:hypothetical protein
MRRHFVARIEMGVESDALPWSLSAQPDAPKSGASEKVGLLRSG